MLLRDLARAFAAGVIDRTRGAPTDVIRALHERRFELLAVLARDLGTLDASAGAVPLGCVCVCEGGGGCV